MSRTRLTLALACLALARGVLSGCSGAACPAGGSPLAAETAPAPAGAIILDFKDDPLGAGSPSMDLQGPGADQIVFDPLPASAYPSDPAGSVLGRYDSTLPTTRAVASLGEVVTEQDDFLFGAVITIRPEGFEADPFGFHPITFSLINSLTTGFNRTGSLSDFRSDAFDSIDVAWFPQVSPIFGGPYLAPNVFGSAVSDDAFANFAFGSVPFDLTPGVPHLITAEHLASGRRLVVTVHALGPGGRPLPSPGGRVELDLSHLTEFAVDALAITAYEDGFNVFTLSGRSVRADVDFDLLFFAPGSLGSDGSLPSLMGLLRRDTEGAHGLSIR